MADRTPSLTEQSSGPENRAESSQSSQSIFWFAATTLLGAFMVFQIQPVISKCVLPWFGGTPAVWTTCMLFFQLLLFGGYLYAHLLRSLFRPAIQAAIHLVILSAAALMLPIEPSDAWKPSGSESPTLYLLWLLASHVGMPYFVLSSTGPLIQAWLSYRDSSDRVYRLYALSNTGSLVALLSYPFVVEPMLSVSHQSTAWSLMFCAFVLVQGVVAIGLFRVTGSGTNRDESRSVNKVTPTWQRQTAWIALPALASTMLLIVTNHVCQDVAVVPFLWVLPLSLYLVSFIVCFDSPQWYRPKLTAAITVLAIIAIQSKGWLPHPIQLIVIVTSFMTLLMGVCLMCHGEVARLKPHAERLTQYYAMLSAGGAIGGLIVAVFCPLLLDSFAELPFSLIVVQTLTFLLFFACRGWRETQYDWSRAYRLRYGAAWLFAIPLVSSFLHTSENTIASDRNFFGVLRVLQDDKGLYLVHGSTVHGMQRHGEGATEPTTYYGRSSGVGLAIAELQKDKPELSIGVVGLGCGVLASYGRPEDHFDIIEINAGVLEIANEYFTFMKQCPSAIEHHLGDGRLVLERMTDKKFDILVLDAFSSDAIPAHLLTREAVALFKQRLADNGVLAIHVSNNHLNLVPLVHRLSVDAGLTSKVVRSDSNKELGTTKAIWMLIGQEQLDLWDRESLVAAQPATAKELSEAPMWTDQHHNLVSVLRIW